MSVDPSQTEPTTARTTKASKNMGKARLGKTLGSHVDATAAAFPVNLLSQDDSPRLHSTGGENIEVNRMTKPAVFWDRDNTLIEDPGYISDPRQVKLLPGAAGSLRRLADAGFENIIVTNQSGIARGLYDEAQLEKIHERLRELLAVEGAGIDAIYYCPYLDGPEAVVEKYRASSDLRKPAPGMIAQASRDRKIDLATSWMVGNSLCDTQAGRAAGCRTILIADGDASERRDPSVDFIASTLEQAVHVILGQSSDTNKSPDGHPGRDSALSAAVQEILALLRKADLREQADDFSLCRLVGIVVQMAAIAVLLWAAYTMVQGSTYGVQIVRFMFALVLQVLALTCFFLSKR